MSHTTVTENERPDFDEELKKIAQYVMKAHEPSKEALETARYNFMDSLGCALLALRYSECRKLLGPTIPGTQVPYGARVPGTPYILDPIKAAFDIGAMIRWLDFNDTWLAAEWGHPSDNIGGILAVADYISQKNAYLGLPPLTMHDVFIATIKAHEIQGILALENAFNRVGLDHVILVKVATAAVVTHMLGGTEAHILNALSLAFVDGQSLRTYRHAPNTGSRKSWAAGDATARGVQLALMAMKGEMGYPSALTAPRWGFYDVLFGGESFKVSRPYGSYVMENILFKIAFPAEFHSQTAIECAFKLHNLVADNLGQIEKIVLTTQEPAIRIISKTGPLYNAADRDHCLQYMVAIGLLFGRLTADDFEDERAADPRIDTLRARMEVVEDPQFTLDYYDENKRAIGNAIQVYFKDGTHTDKIVVEYPLGHRRRRAEGIPLLLQKFKNNLLSAFPPLKTEEIYALSMDKKKIETMPVNHFMEIIT
ncbi:MAG: prpD [Gammaproteobacteria bacterium]|jgi:2-methylcitrate dehydratase|nr:prpD [Gammaproteobacteria bacterium]